jgi:hypothetical protein
MPERGGTLQPQIAKFWIRLHEVTHKTAKKAREHLGPSLEKRQGILAIYFI